MDSIKKAATDFILTPEYHDLLSIVKGFRNGLVYGAKIRFPHALVMTLLFRRSKYASTPDPLTLARTRAKETAHAQQTA
jgi:hypothetical protein